MEKYIHELLDDRRVGKQEIFRVTEQELDEAIAEAFRFVEESAPFLSKAGELAKQKPDEEMLDPSEEILDIYKELRDAERRYFMLEKQIELLRCKMKVFIGTHGGIKGLATWKWKPKSGLDTPRFKEERRELYDQYSIDRSKRVFEDLQADLTKLCD